MGAGATGGGRTTSAAIATPLIGTTAATINDLRILCITHLLPLLQEGGDCRARPESERGLPRKRAACCPSVTQPVPHPARRGTVRGARNLCGDGGLGVGLDRAVARFCLGQRTG